MSGPLILTKRRLLRLLPRAMAGLAVASPAPGLADDGKMSKQQADYQDSPKDIQMCATCTLFVPPRACKVVAGDISPNGWCRVYAMAD
jgi:hypothetical protein